MGATYPIKIHNKSSHDLTVSFDNHMGDILICSGIIEVTNIRYNTRYVCCHNDEIDRHIQIDLVNKSAEPHADLTVEIEPDGTIIIHDNFRANVKISNRTDVSISLIGYHNDHVMKIVAPYSYDTCSRVKEIYTMNGVPIGYDSLDSEIITDGYRFTSYIDCKSTMVVITKSQ